MILSVSAALTKFKKYVSEAEEMAQQLGALFTFSEDLSLVSNMHITDYSLS